VHGPRRARLTGAAQGFADYDTLDSDAYTLHRVLHGVPEGCADITPLRATPMESVMDAMGGGRSSSLAAEQAILM
jgi:hypothetical protein